MDKRGLTTWLFFNMKRRLTNIRKKIEQVVGSSSETHDISEKKFEIPVGK